jgi:hypothetical protein
VANIFSGFHTRSYFLGLATGVILCVLFYFLFNLKSCGNATFEEHIPVVDGSTHFQPAISFSNVPPKQKAVIRHDTVTIYDGTSATIVAATPEEADSVWTYEEIRDEDTLELAIDNRSGELQYLNIYSPRREKDDTHNLSPKGNPPPLFSDISFLKPFHFYYSGSAVRDPFNPYWEVSATAEFYIAGGLGLITHALYQYDGLLQNARHTGRLLVGAIYHFE